MKKAQENSNQLKLSGEYHEDTSFIGKSMISTFMESRTDYHDYYLTKTRKPTFSRKTDFGTIMHAILLEDRPVEDVARLYPKDCLKSNGHRNSKPAGEFEKECSKYSAFAVKHPELDRIHACYDAVQNSMLGPLIQQATSREEAVLWQDDRGLRFKCKPDFDVRLPQQNWCYDLKFSSQSKPTDYQRVADRFKYWLQDAHYRIGLSAITGNPTNFAFFVVEDEAPFRIGRYEFPENLLEERKDAWEFWTDQLLDAMDNDIWDDDWTVQRGQVNTLYFNPQHWGCQLTSLQWD